MYSLQINSPSLNPHRKNMLDLKFVWTKVEANRLFEKIYSISLTLEDGNNKDEGFRSLRRYYYLDLIFPIVYSPFFSCVIAWLLGELQVQKEKESTFG